MISSHGQNTPQIKRFVVGPLATNCYLVFDPGSSKGVLIDPGMFDEEIAGYIEKEKIEVLWTVNTHGHADHTSGNDHFGFPVLMHKNSMARGHLQAERFLSDGDTIEFGDFKLKTIYTPGHTPGGISLRCGNILFSGDTLFYEGVGRTDRPEGDTGALLRSIKEKLMTLPDEVRVFPGHGPETTIGHERQFNPFI